MKRALLTAVLALAVLANPLHAQTPATISQSLLSVVFVSNTNQQMFCTGVVVGIVHVLTAEHCVPENNDGVMIEDNVPVRVVKKNDWLALLQASEPIGKPILKVAEKNSLIGASVAATGFVDTFGTRLTLTRHVAGYTPHVEGMMFIDGPLISGMSGGPLVDEQGKLVGISQASNPFTGMVSHAKAIKDFLK